jgi:hypothetical protein
VSKPPKASPAVNASDAGSGIVITLESDNEALAAFTPSPRNSAMRLNVNVPFAGKFTEL